jgi:hypothetical protein
MASLTPELDAAARELLDGNWREGVEDGMPYGFSVPSPRSYPWQWYWDSCKHAIVRARWDRERAHTELRTLLGASEDGFIGHTVMWGSPLGLGRAGRYNIARRSDRMTRTIQPPMLAWAWLAVVGDPALEPGILAHHAWLRHHRGLSEDGLLWLIAPDESGLDASPKFDHVWGPRAQGLPGFVHLIHRNRRLGFDARRIEQAGLPVLCEVLTNVMWSLSEQALGRPSLTGALVERCWDERLGRFFDSARSPYRELERSARPLTWDTLAPLALPDLPDAIAERLIHETLLSGGFWGAVPLAAVAVDSPAHSCKERFWGFHRHWRGHSWVNAAWLVSLGLRRRGYDDEADAVASSLSAVIAREGFREYYDSRTGRGLAARQFGWSTLICEIADPSPGARDSYLAAVPASIDR